MSGGLPRIVWITGAGSGIGRALALEFAAKGERVVLSGRTEPQLRSLQSAIREKNGRADVVLCDVRRNETVEEACRKIVESIGVPDILVNNAGITVFKEFLSTTIDEFDDILQTNLRGSFLVTKSVLPHMVAHTNGLIINVVSFAAKTTYAESSVYAASKAGVAALMEGLRAEVRGKGIKILNVFPGAVLTPIWHPKVQAKYGNKMMTPEDVAKMIVEISRQPASMMVEEIVLRPQQGDINA